MRVEEVFTVGIYVGWLIELYWDYVSGTQCINIPTYNVGLFRLWMTYPVTPAAAASTISTVRAIHLHLLDR
jgi:hypothetical protein